MNSFFLWATLGLVPFVATVDVSRDGGCPKCECCSCCETGSCECKACTCECCSSDRCDR